MLSQAEHEDGGLDRGRMMTGPSAVDGQSDGKRMARLRREGSTSKAIPAKTGKRDGMALLL